MTHTFFLKCILLRLKELEKMNNISVKITNEPYRSFYMHNYSKRWKKKPNKSIITKFKKHSEVNTNMEGMR